MNGVSNPGTLNVRVPSGVVEVEVVVVAVVEVGVIGVVVVVVEAVLGVVVRSKGDGGVAS